DLIDALIGIVDDNGEVVREHAIVAYQHDIVDGSGVPAVQDVVHGELPRLAEQTDRRRSLGPPASTLGRGQVAARARVRPGRTMWRRRRLSDLAPRAEALVGEPCGAEPVDRRTVEAPA